MTIIFNHDQCQLCSNITTIYKHIWIEQALKQIPTCIPDDRPRQRALLYTLQEWTHFTQKYNIRYWIAYKTLVGYVQRHALLPHDSDIDLLIMAQDTAQLFQFSHLNFSSIYELRIHPEWYIVEETKRSYFHSEGIHFGASNARFINRKDSIHINIWPLYDYHPDQTRMKNNSKAMLTQYDKNSKWKSTPKEWTFPLKKCLFSGIKVWCPAHPEELVANIYGSISVNISSAECINGSWTNFVEHRTTKKTTIMNNQNMSTAQMTKAQTTATRLNDDDLIEKALEHIPICTPNDRPRQRTLLTTLQAWSHLAEQYHIPYWISYGTLVGYVQRRGLLPHDLDVDIIMISDDTPQLMKLSQLNFSSDYEIKVQPQWHIVDNTYRSYFRKEGIHFVAPNARFIHRKTQYHIDIFPAHDFNPLYANKSIGDKQSENLTVYDFAYHWLSYPRNWTYPLETCYFSEIKVSCPAQPEKFVAIIYGSNAVRKSDTECVDGRWVAAV